MANIIRKTKLYPSNLTNKEWERIALLMPPKNRRDRKQATDFREAINTLHYLVRSGLWLECRRFTLVRNRQFTGGSVG